VAITNFLELGSIYITNHTSVGGYAGSEVWEQNIYPGSKVFQGDIFGISGIVNVDNRVAGSIVNLPDVTITDAVTIGSYTTQGVSFTGSTEVFSDTGSVEVYGTLSATAGSEQWIQNELEVSGIVGVSNFGDLGSSVVVTNFGALGSSSVITNFGDLGSNAVITNFNDLGSTVVVDDAVTIGSYSTQNVALTGSLEVWQTTNADMQVQATQEGTWDVGNLTTGSVRVVSQANVARTISNFGDLGSDVVVTNFDDIGSSVVVTNFGDLGSTAVVDNFGDLGSSRIITAGSVTVINDLTINDMGSPGFKQATAIASGTYTQVWSIGEAGSRVEIHGYHISTNLAGIVNIVGSATAPTLINSNYLNFASGAVIEKTFVTPFIPRGADIPIGIQTTSAGSTAVTIYGREVV